MTFERNRIMKTYIKYILTLSTLIAGILGGCSKGPESIALFDGATLDGWQNFGGGKFFVEDGAIVGETAPLLPNSFLATNQMYSDFELELDVKVDPLLNSGIQIRSNVYPEETTTIRWGGTFNEDGTKNVRERVWEKGRFWGYQVELDPTDRAWSGSLYEEGGRGFLHTPGEDEAAKQAFKPEDWNHVKIRVIGDHFQTWINGVPVADVHDSLTSTGYIALQLHGVGKNQDKVGKRVLFKNIELTQL
jgi:hypothetical protein